jgi:hypothetical protein
MLGDDLEALGLGEPSDGGALGVNAKPRAALFASANPVVDNQRLRRIGGFTGEGLNVSLTLPAGRLSSGAPAANPRRTLVRRNGAHRCDEGA